MDPHSIVVVSLHTPKEKVWGELLAINPSGITLRGIDLNSFDHFIRQINEPDGERIGLPTIFFPMNRVERISLDEPSGSIPSMNELFARKVGRSLSDKLSLSSSFVLLAFTKPLAWWLTILVLSRDVLILIVAVVILLTSGYRPFPPSIYGKLTTATEIILVFLVVLGAAYPHYHVAGLNQILIYAVTALSISSGFHYSFSTARHLHGPTSGEK